MALKNNLGAEHLSSDLCQLGLREDKASLLARQWSAEFSALARTMMARTISVNQLVDIDWAFGVTAASSELNHQGSCYLQLKLVIDKGHTKEQVRYLKH